MTRHGLPIEERFWSKVFKGSNYECWPWTASTNPHGYGQFKVDGGRLQRSHRVAYELTYGEIPAGLVVRHRCDNPPCCNPSHLLLGTQADNVEDMNRRGRAAASKERVR